MKNTIITISLIFFLSPAFAQKDSSKARHFNYVAINAGLFGSSGEREYINYPSRDIITTPSSGNIFSINSEIIFPKSSFGIAGYAGYSSWVDSGKYQQYNILIGPASSIKIADRILWDIKLMFGIAYCTSPSISYTENVDGIQLGAMPQGESYYSYTQENFNTKAVTASSFIFDIGTDLRFNIYKRMFAMIGFNYVGAEINFKENTQVTSYFTNTGGYNRVQGNWSSMYYYNPPQVSDRPFTNTLYSDYFTLSVCIGYCFGK